MRILASFVTATSFALSFVNAPQSMADVSPISLDQGLWQTWTVPDGSVFRPLDPSGGVPFGIDQTVGNHGDGQVFTNSDLAAARAATVGQSNPAIKMGYNGSCPVWSDHENYAEYSYQLANGTSLPAGISLTCDGLLIGNLPTVAATYNVDINICDSNSLCSTAHISLTVPAGSFHWNSQIVSLSSAWAIGSTPPPQLGTYLESFLDNPSGVVSFSCNGTLPIGVNCDSNEGISGTFASLGSSAFEITATSGGQASTIWATINVCLIQSGCTEAQASVDRTPTITAGVTANSRIVTIPTSVTSVAIPATSFLPATTINFSGPAPVSLTISPVDANPAAASDTPFTISESPKIVDIQIPGTLNGTATVCLDGASTDHLYHFTGGAWIELPSRSYVNGQVCGITESFSPFAAAEPALVAATPIAPPPPPQPYITVASAPTLHKVGTTAVCTSGTFNYGVHYFDGSADYYQANSLVSSLSYSFLVNGQPQSALASTSANKSATVDLSALPATGLLTCQVTGTEGGVSALSSSTANNAGLTAASLLQSTALSAASTSYQLMVAANQVKEKAALADNRSQWRTAVALAQATFAASAHKSSDAKIQITAIRAATATYKAGTTSIPAQLIADNATALKAQIDANAKAAAAYAAAQEAIGYGVVLGL